MKDSKLKNNKNKMWIWAAIPSIVCLLILFTVLLIIPKGSNQEEDKADNDEETEKIYNEHNNGLPIDSVNETSKSLEPSAGHSNDSTNNGSETTTSSYSTPSSSYSSSGKSSTSSYSSSNYSSKDDEYEDIEDLDEDRDDLYYFHTEDFREVEDDDFEDNFDSDW